ncbi:ABC-type dipeptide/oligopeptide/nickel transport system ATPase component [Rhodoglobus vestalii]|uniref:ABC-type dipeptide/oligopeptide/nickel transport system ATPase component n=1 Tax=Rhodoglobus vestalii TaxID=193384 RepID=A0A8H2K4Y1_9MICO|nr:ABC transporter ATP-binding protein [Rhodoglobus vestalii]TQO18828.1 ABC-type dipeptide/oligopeptide/nickel transport system ATPase component [Rhodoglobus vestalii]
MLEIRDLCMTIASERAEFDILRNVSLSVAAGESVGLVGESGSGKSMTLRSILRIEPSNATVTGNITFAGADVLFLEGEALRRMRSTDVSMIAQNPHAVLNPVLPIVNYLIEGMHDAQGMPKGAARLRAGELLEQVGIDGVDRVLGSYPHQLSGGMLQRVVIAGAIAGKPKLMLADEPTTALDVTTQAEVMAILDEFRRDLGMAMLYVTHDLDLAAAVCDRISVMKDGQIVETGVPEQLRDNPQHPYTRQLMDARPAGIIPQATVPSQTALSEPDVNEGESE